MKIRNYTPHTITIWTDDGKIDIPSCGVIRISQHDMHAGWIDGIPVVKTIWGDVQLPDGHVWYPGIYLVSSVVLDAYRGYTLPDGVVLAAPNTGPDSVVRDTDGRIIGVKSLVVR